MSFRRIVSLACAAVCLMGMGVAAAEVDCDAVYCFTDQDFSQQEQVSGICITGLPDWRSVCRLAHRTDSRA